MKWKVALNILLAAMCFFSPAYADVPEIYEIPGIIKNKIKSKMKPPYKPPYMVQTYDEWLEKANDIELEQRNFEKPKPEINEKLNKVEDPVILFARHNIPAGSNEADLTAIKKALTLSSIGVSSPLCDNLAVVHYHYSPAYNQISSEILIVPLDTKKSRIDRILEAKVIDTNKGQNLTSGTYEFQQDLYSTLTVVDWSADGKVVLVKEKIGSTNSGIFRTRVIAIFLDENKVSDSRANKPKGSILYDYTEYPQLQKAIAKYWKKKQNLILDSLRWDVKVLGFNEEKPNQAVVLAYAYEMKSYGRTREVFLGTWGLDIKTGNVELISLEQTGFKIAANGLVLKFRTE